MAPVVGLAGLSILLVEDQTLIALDAEEMLRDAGVASVVTCATQAEALAYLEGNVPDAAILDVSLGHETSIDVAQKLVELSVPFVIATGYGEQAAIEVAFHNAPRLTKPYRASALSDAVLGVLKRPG